MMSYIRELIKGIEKKCFKKSYSSADQNMFFLLVFNYR